MGIFGKIDKRIIIGVVIFLLLLAVGGIVLLFHNKNDDEVSEPNKDALRFKEDYAELNGKENSKGLKYPTVELKDDNPFRYINEEEAVKVLENGTGIIYFGFNSCPWCRNLVPNIVEAAKEADSKEIYYLDVMDIRSTLSYENKKVTTTREGSESYYKLLELLDDYLEKFYVTDAKGKKYDTGEKRLYAPTLVAVVDGKIVGFHEGTLKEHTNGYDALDEDQVKELRKILVDLFSKVNSGLCSEKC